MLDTIRSKILVLTISVMLLLSIILSVSAYINLKNQKGLMTDTCDFTIFTFAEKINKEIVKLENNAKDLALMGEVYFKSGKEQDISNFIVENIFKNYENSLGGGIWFEPYAIKSGQKLSSVYAYRNKTNKVVLDSNFSSEAYNYLNQSWYKEIKPKVQKKHVVAWSKPYFEKQGSDTLMTTAGAGIYSNGKLIGLSTVDWKISSIVDTVATMKPTQNSFALFADTTNDFIIVSNDSKLENQSLLGKSLKEIPWYNSNLKDKDTFNYHGIKYISFIKSLDNGMILVINVPENELFGKVNQNVSGMLTLLIFACLLIAGGMYLVLRRNVNTPIAQLTEMADEIGKGNFDTEIKFDKQNEFATLASTFNNMSKDIKQYVSNINTINKEKEKIESELSIAKTIQHSSLPEEFLPKMDEIDIYAYMNSAKEVGGDFYDFFFINPTQFMFLIADVSGKGIPSALFMMTTKALIKNIACENTSPKRIIEKINRQICENNKHGFFVTMFACIVDICTGDVFFMNCGHNPPLIKRKDGKYKYLEMASNLVLGVYPNFNYKIQKTKLNEGDIIFLYTDGITEALDSRNDLYGETRLLICLNDYKTCDSNDMKTIVEDVESDVKNFVGDVQQSDDITMLAFKYNGCKIQNSEEKLTIPAKVEKFDEFNSWLENSCEKLRIYDEDLKRLQLVAEEVFVNIANYAFPNSTGNVETTLFRNGNELSLEFIDKGIQYNPLETNDPDITKNLQDREKGGLGIFIVKNSVDYIGYQYKDEQNILTLKIIRS